MSASGLRRLRWYGRVLATDFPFVVRLPETEGAEDVTLKRCQGAVPRASGGESFRRIFSAETMPGAEPWLEAFEEEGRYHLRFAGFADFEIDGDHIGCRLLKGTAAEAEAFFLGLVSALWLELGGALSLHGAAVLSPRGVAGFLGYNRAGKSSLAASFLAAGCPLLTDDVLALDIYDRQRVLARPGFPQIRLWPASAEELVDNARDLDPVHPGFDKRRVPVGPSGLGMFHDRPEALCALLLPERTGVAIEMTRLSPRDATIELVRHSFLGALGEAAVGVARRFERIATVAERVPVFRLAYPNGLEQLGRVREAVLERLETL